MEESSTVICMNCMAPNDATDKFCSECKMALIETNYLDPVATLFEQGVAQTKAVYRPTRPIVVATIWVLFLPVLILSPLGMLAGLARPGMGGFVGFWFSAGLTVLSAVALYRVTRNYFYPRPDNAELRR